MIQTVRVVCDSDAHPGKCATVDEFAPAGPAVWHSIFRKRDNFTGLVDSRPLVGLVEDNTEDDIAQLRGHYDLPCPLCRDRVRITADVLDPILTRLRAHDIPAISLRSLRRVATL